MAHHTYCSAMSLHSQTAHSRVRRCMCVCVRRHVSPPWRDLLFICGVRVGEGVGHILQLHIPSVGGVGQSGWGRGGHYCGPRGGGHYCGPRGGGAAEWSAFVRVGESVGEEVHCACVLQALEAQ